MIKSTLTLITALILLFCTTLANAKSSIGFDAYEDAGYEAAKQSLHPYIEQSVRSGIFYESYALDIIYRHSKNQLDDILYQGAKAYFNTEFKTAHKIFLPLAENGNSDAQYFLGMMYRFGQVVSKDIEEGVKWFHHSAEQGHSYAQYTLGLMYSGNSEIHNDNTEYGKWIRRSAEQGNIFGQNQLAILYFLGQGVLQDYLRSYMWSIIATSNGHNSVDMESKWFVSNFSVTDLIKAQDMANRCLESQYKDC